MKAPFFALTLLTSCVSTSNTAPDVIPYGLDTCVVMDSKLGSMGDPIVRVHEGQEVKFCCMPCVDEFESDPEFYMQKLAEERAARN